MPLSVGSPNIGTEQAGDVLIKEIGKKFNKSCKMYTCLEVPNVPAPTEHSILNFSSVHTANKNLYIYLTKGVRNNTIPFVIGGDHSIGVATTTANLAKYGDDLLVVWIDAHTDINTPQSSPSHHYHGMPNAITMGLCDKSLSLTQNEVVLKGNHLAIIGARSIDEGEKITLKDNHVNYISAIEVRKIGIVNYIKHLKEITGCKYVQISFDVDGLDPSQLTATWYEIPKGLLKDEVKLIIKTLLENFELASFDCVEYNPLKDNDNAGCNTLLDIFTEVLE